MADVVIVFTFRRDEYLPLGAYARNGTYARILGSCVPTPATCGLCTSPRWPSDGGTGSYYG